MDTLHFIGTSYRAASWLEIGQTKGGGRQDRFNENAKTVKAIYGYELEPDIRTRLAAISEPLQVTALQISEGLDGDEWAGHEFGGAHLGDRRSNMWLAEFPARSARSRHAPSAVPRKETSRRSSRTTA